MVDPRTLWVHYEPVHAVTYFVPETMAAFEAIGLRGFWRGYFAGRAAPLGATGPEPVIATFYGFAPVMVRRAFPDVWQRTTPEATLDARREGTTRALRRIAPDAEYAEAAGLLERAAADADIGGRVLGAANAALATPEGDVERLWHAATVLREHRGDGHVAALVAYDVTPCESLVLRAATDIPRENLQPFRGWTDEEWDAATDRLRERGLLDAAGAITAAGLALREEVERATDAAAARPWRSFSDEEAERLVALLRPITHECLGVIPPQTPIGLPRRG